MFSAQARVCILCDRMDTHAGVHMHIQPGLPSRICIAKNGASLVPSVGPGLAAGHLLNPKALLPTSHSA